jgi:hypothetical protein
MFSLSKNYDQVTALKDEGLSNQDIFNQLKNQKLADFQLKALIMETPSSAQKPLVKNISLWHKILLSAVYCLIIFGYFLKYQQHPDKVMSILASFLALTIFYFAINSQKYKIGLSVFSFVFINSFILNSDNPFGDYLKYTLIFISIAVLFLVFRFNKIVKGSYFGIGGIK